jgi:hypothetical protein
MTKIRTYQAIITKYIGPSNTKGSRIKATAAAGSITLHLDHALSTEENHAKAAEALANKFKWRGCWYGGGMPDDSGYCWVSAETSVEHAFRTHGEPANV